MSVPAWTVREVLSWTTDLFIRKGLQGSARLDAELLLARVMRCDRVRVYMDHDRPLSEAERTELRGLVARRARGEPVAYLLGRREFYGLDLMVDARVLIPRPETEILVDEALSRLDEAERGPVVDVGTGSGAMALALAANRPRLRVLALDIDAGAVAVARDNARAHGLSERVLVARADLLTPLQPRSVSLLVSNPPYVALGDPRVQDSVVRFEPGRAIFAGADGLWVIRRLLLQATEVLLPGGRLLVEVGEGQAPALSSLARSLALGVEAIRKDLAGIQRVVVLQRAG